MYYLFQTSWSLISEALKSFLQMQILTLNVYFFYCFIFWHLHYFCVCHLGIIFRLSARFNSSMQKVFMGKSKNVANGNAAASSEMEDGNTCYDYVWDDDPSWPLLAGKVNQTGRAPKIVPASKFNLV